MIAKFLVLCLVGKLVMYLWTISPYAEWLSSKNSFFQKLFECHLCLGVWVYPLLAWAFKVNILDAFFTIPVISELITGGVTSFLVFLASEGWNSRFRSYEIKV